MRRIGSGSGLAGLGAGSSPPFVFSVSPGQNVKSTLIQTGISSGLFTAAMYDPEPFSKAALTIAAGLVSLFGRAFQGCGQSCTLSTAAANEVEQFLQDNLRQYFSIPAPRLRSLQQKFLANFDYAWNELTQRCGQIGGQGGTNCVADRRAGACKWTNDGHGGPAGSGSVCWNWFVGYRDPIANDPDVISDAQAQIDAETAARASGASSYIDPATGNVVQTTGLNGPPGSGVPTQLLIIGGLLVAAMAMGSD